MLGERKSITELIEWQKDGNKIAIFCAGQNGYTFYRILKLLEIDIDCIIDNDNKKWNKNIFDDVVCYSPTILSEREDYLVYICISPQYYNELYRQAKRSNILHIENVYDIMADIVKHHKELYFRILSELPYGRCFEFFYNSKLYMNIEEPVYVTTINERIVVYTSVFGTYDDVYEPQCLSENIDYYFVSEQKPEGLKKYRWLDAKKFLPSDLENPIDKNRYIKMHPHLLFPNYSYSIYIDGNVEVLRDMSVFAQKSKTGISVFSHPFRDDIYMEALAIANAKRAKVDAIQMQMKKYMKDGFPEVYGMPEMRIIAREHNNPICIKLMKKWWEEFSTTDTKRDQLSFMYVMWKTGLELKDLFLLGNDMRKSDHIIVHSHANER